jgi:hypothetical protein
VGYILVNLRKRPGLHGHCNSWVGWRVDLGLWKYLRLYRLDENKVRKFAEKGGEGWMFQNEVEYEESEVRGWR